MNTKMYRILTVLLLAIALFSGCEDRTDLTEPEVDIKNVDFTSYVAVGNSLTAGFQNNALYKASQEYSFPAMIANQTNAGTFVQPLVENPGIPPYMLVKGLTASSVTLGQAGNLGDPINSAYAKPYNNLGVPGAILYDLIDNTDYIQKSASRNNPYFSMVLRSQAMGSTVLEQAFALQPTFMTLWIGNNDVLGYATSGGTSGTDATRTKPTEVQVFTMLYNQVADAISQNTDAKVAVANIPDVSVIPYFNTVGPQMGASLKASNIVNVYYMKNDGSVLPAAVDGLISGQELLTLTFSSYASLAGKPTGIFYRETGVPAGVDTTKPFAVHPQNPIPSAFILDREEIQIAKDHIDSYNNVIASAVSNNSDFVLVDINSFFNDLKASGGAHFNGQLFTTRYITGGLFSLDGVHPTSQGYAIVANQFIKAINGKWEANIPEINVAAIPGSIPVE